MSSNEWEHAWKDQLIETSSSSNKFGPVLDGTSWSHYRFLHQFRQVMAWFQHVYTSFKQAGTWFKHISGYWFARIYCKCIQLVALVIPFRMIPNTTRFYEGIRKMWRFKILMTSFPVSLDGYNSASTCRRYIKPILFWMYSSSSFQRYIVWHYWIKLIFFQ